MICTCTNPDVGFCNTHEGKDVSADPTTAEAFAMIGQAINLYVRGTHREDANDALALLERRTRAMEAFAEPHWLCACGAVMGDHDVDGRRVEQLRDGHGMVWGEGKVLCPGFRRALEALTLLERRRRDSPSLAVLVEAFCLDAEAAEASQEAKRRGGQQVPFHGPFCHLQPSARGELNRWARDFREALKK